MVTTPRPNSRWPRNCVRLVSMWVFSMSRIIAFPRLTCRACGHRRNSFSHCRSTSRQGTISARSSVTGVSCRSEPSQRGRRKTPISRKATRSPLNFLTTIPITLPAANYSGRTSGRRNCRNFNPWCTRTLNQCFSWESNCLVRSPWRSICPKIILAVCSANLSPSFVCCITHR